jgi:hypothetical protein
MPLETKEYSLYLGNKPIRKITTYLQVPMGRKGMKSRIGKVPHFIKYQIGTDSYLQLAIGSQKVSR